VWEGEGGIEDRLELFGPVILDPKNRYFLGALQHSNNTGEIQAACEGLIECLLREPQSVLWWYDSELTANVAKGNSFVSGETELCNSLRKLFARASARAKKFGGIRCEHVYSHLGFAPNEAADVLADRGVREQCTVGRYGMYSEDKERIVSDAHALRFNPKQPDLDLDDTWSSIVQAVQETSAQILPFRDRPKKRKAEPSAKTLALESKVRQGGLSRYGERGVPTTQAEKMKRLGADLRASRKKDSQDRVQQIVSDMTLAYERGDVKGFFECMSNLSGESKFSSVQPLHIIEKNAQGKVKVKEAFENTKAQTDKWCEEMSLRFKQRPGDEQREGDTLHLQQDDKRFGRLDRDVFDEARALTKPFKAGG
jgi:ribonuclease HI